ILPLRLALLMGPFRGRLHQRGVLPRIEREETDPVGPPRRLRLGEERERECEWETQNKPDRPHGHLGGGWMTRSLAERHNAHQHSAYASRSQRDEEQAAEAVSQSRSAGSSFLREDSRRGPARPVELPRAELPPRQRGKNSRQ